MPINPEMLKQLLDEFVEKEAVTREEINVVQQQIEELELRVVESKERLKLVGADRDKINTMMERYAKGDWGAIPEAADPVPSLKKEEPKPEPARPAQESEPAATSIRRTAMASLIKARETTPVSEPEAPPPVMPVTPATASASATIKPLATTAAASFAQAAAEADKASTANIPILDPVLTQPPPDVVSASGLPVVESPLFESQVSAQISGQFPAVASEPTTSSGQFSTVSTTSSGQFPTVSTTSSGQFPPVNPTTISGQYPTVAAQGSFPDFEDVPADEFQTSQPEQAPASNPFLKSSFTVSRPTMQEMEQPRPVEQAPAVMQDIASSPFTQPVQQPQQQDPAPASSGPNISFDSMFETEDSQAGEDEEKADNDDTVKSINDALRGLFR